MGSRWKESDERPDPEVQSLGFLVPKEFVLYCLQIGKSKDTGVKELAQGHSAPT